MTHLEVFSELCKMSKAEYDTEQGLSQSGTEVWGDTSEWPPVQT